VTYPDEYRGGWEGGGRTDGARRCGGAGAPLQPRAGPEGWDIKGHGHWRRKRRTSGGDRWEEDTVGGGGHVLPLSRDRGSSPPPK
jgi:hypothetical protein